MTITSELDRLWHLERGIGLTTARREEDHDTFFASLGEAFGDSTPPEWQAECSSFIAYATNPTGGDLLTRKQNTVLVMTLFPALGAIAGAIFFGKKGAIVGAVVGVGIGAAELSREYSTWKDTHCGV